MALLVIGVLVGVGAVAAVQVRRSVARREVDQAELGVDLLDLPAELPPYAPGRFRAPRSSFSR